MIEKLLNLDIKLFYLIHYFRTPFLDSILPLFSKSTFLYGFYFISAFLLSFFLLVNGYQKKAFFLLLFMLFGFLASDFSCGRIFKPLFQRERPFASLPKVYFYTEGEFKFLNEPLTYKKTLSFPSCHATNASFGSSFLSFLFPKLTPLFILTGLLVGYSRIYLGHHFPLDVLSGYFLGFILALCWYFLLKRIRP